MDDLVVRLMDKTTGIHSRNCGSSIGPRGCVACEAADRITALQARVGELEDDNAKLVKAAAFEAAQWARWKAMAEELAGSLGPFAEALVHLHPGQPDDGETLDGFKCSDFRRAAQSLSRFNEMKAGG